MLLAGTILTVLPSVLVATIEVVIGDDRGIQPEAIFTTVIVLFLLNSVLNPIIQSYFRRDVYDYLVHCYKLLRTKCTCTRTFDDLRMTVSSLI